MMTSAAAPIASSPKVSRQLVVAVEGAGEIGERRDDEELPFLAEIGRQGRQARDVFVAVACEGVEASLPRGRALKAIAGSSLSSEVMCRSSSLPATLA